MKRFYLALLVISFAAALLVSAETISVDYDHPSGVGAADQDCFDDTGSTCLTRGLKGPVYNAGKDGKSAISWACGSCEEADDWQTKLDKSLPCLEGDMNNLPGEALCLKTESNGLWDIEFSYWQSGRDLPEGEGGGFSYTRSKEVEEEEKGPRQKKILMSSRPFWKSYAEDCGIEYNPELGPQMLRQLCHEKKESEVEMEYEFYPKVIRNMSKDFKVTFNSVGLPLSNMPVLVNGKEYTTDETGSVSFAIERGDYLVEASKEGYKDFKVIFRIGG